MWAIVWDLETTKDIIGTILIIMGPCCAKWYNFGTSKFWQGNGNRVNEMQDSEWVENQKRTAV